MSLRLLLSLLAATMVALPAVAEEIARYYGWRTNGVLIFRNEECPRRGPRHAWHAGDVIGGGMRLFCWRTLDNSTAVLACPIALIQSGVEAGCARIPVSELR